MNLQKGPPTNYGYLPKKLDPLYSKKRESSEIIEFKNELTHWSNRIEEISSHYRSSLLPGQIQELVELKTKINHVKESITPGRKSFTPIISPINTPITSPITSPPESPRSIAFKKKLPPIPVKDNFKPDPPSTRPPIQMTKSAPTLIPAPKYQAPVRTRKSIDEISPPIRNDSLRRSKSKSNYSSSNDEEQNSRRRPRSNRNSWDKKKRISAEEDKPSSAPKSFYHPEKGHGLPPRRRSGRKYTNNNASPPDVKLGLALIKAVKYLDNNTPLSPRSRRR